MVGRAAAWAVALVALVPTGLGQADPAFFASVGLAEPLDVEGSVALPIPKARVYADGTFDDASAFDRPVMRADRVWMKIKEQQVDGALVPAVPELGWTATEDQQVDGAERASVAAGPGVGSGAIEQAPREIVNATLDILAIRAYPQYRVIDFPREDKTDMTGDLPLARCSIQEPVAGTAHPFPRDPDGVPDPDQFVDAPDSKNLEARCAADVARYSEPSMVRIYGLTVQVLGDDFDQIIHTGRVEEPGPGGVGTQWVIRTLQLEHRREPFALDFGRPHNVTLHAEGFLAAGDLRSPATTGRLQWNGQERNGTLDAFEARGAFAVTKEERQRAHIDGNALRVSAFSLPAAPLLPGLPGAALAAVTVLVLAGLAAVAWLFSRVAPDRLLEHPRRAALMDRIRSEPGATVQEIARALGLHWGVAAYHLAALRRGGQVHLARAGGRTALFPLTQGHAPRSAEAWLRRASHARVYAELESSPGEGPTRLAERLGMTQARVSQVLADLAHAGLVEARPDGRRRGYWARPSPPPADP